jgi:hypothetical protein
VKAHTYGTVSYFDRIPCSALPFPFKVPLILLTAHLVETGELIGYLEWAAPVIEETGAVFYMMRVCPIHRVGSGVSTHDGRTQFSDLQEILYAAVVRAGARVMFDTNVAFAEPPCPSKPSEGSDSSSSSPLCERPSVHLIDGTVLETDLIIGADGQHSTVRSSILEKAVRPRRTDTIVLSGNVPTRKILEDDVLKSQSVAYSWVYWFGPRRCFMGASSLLLGCRLSFTTS